MSSPTPHSLPLIQKVLVRCLRLLTILYGGFFVAVGAMFYSIENQCTESIRDYGSVSDQCRSFRSSLRMNLGFLCSNEDLARRTITATALQYFESQGRLSLAEHALAIMREHCKQYRLPADPRPSSLGGLSENLICDVHGPVDDLAHIRWVEQTKSGSSFFRGSHGDVNPLMQLRRNFLVMKLVALCLGLCGTLVVGAAVAVSDERLRASLPIGHQDLDSA